MDLWRIGMGGAATNPMLAAQCNPSATAATDCSSVLASAWASVPITPAPNAPRVPLAALGAAYFGAIGCWFLFVGQAHPRRWGWALPVTLLALYGGYQSYWSVQVMANVIGRWCVGCLWVHAINAAIVLLVLSSFPWTRRRETEPKFPQHRLAFAGVACGAFSLIFHPTFALLLSAFSSATQIAREYEKVTADPVYIAAKYRSQTAVEIPLGEKPPSLGSADAPVTIVAFVDFECSACKQLRSVLLDLTTRDPQTYRVFIKHFPLDQSCNAHARRTVHTSACFGARAYEAAKIVGGPDAARTLRAVLYQRQREIAPTYADEWAKICRLDPAQFKAAMISPESLQPIADDAALADSLGIDAVPALFVNGRRFDQWRSPGAFGKLLPVIHELQKR